ncbi:hypothetical protein WM40_12640 [Robbsia andropogonis]|uniref:Uncharacterized protein n=1 Tax=Robbsia andropogonis TaxID=28092 RepID=A0A0F5JZL8_9BURK|nr:hypothetical protein WM40_12640 [Robbsia andropogonis]
MRDAHRREWLKSRDLSPLTEANRDLSLSRPLHGMPPPASGNDPFRSQYSLQNAFALCEPQCVHE